MSHVQAFPISYHERERDLRQGAPGAPTARIGVTAKPEYQWVVLSNDPGRAPPYHGPVPYQAYPPRRSYLLVGESQLKSAFANKQTYISISWRCPSNGSRPAQSLGCWVNLTQNTAEACQGRVGQSAASLISALQLLAGIRALSLFSRAGFAPCPVSSPDPRPGLSRQPVG